jgi:Mitochondrial carrier protein
MYKTEGISAFTKGIFASILIYLPATALTWGTYELMKAVLGAQNSWQTRKE